MWEKLRQQECTVIFMDVAGPNQGKGYHVAQGVKHMMHKKWLKEVGLFHQQNRRLEEERGNINTTFNQVFLGDSQKKDEKQKENGQGQEPINSQIC